MQENYNLKFQADRAKQNDPYAEDLQKIAKKMGRPGLAEFSLFMIEAHLPLSSIIQNLSYIASPLLSPAIGRERYQRLQNIISEPKQLTLLAEMIETERQAD